MAHEDDIFATRISSSGTLVIRTVAVSKFPEDSSMETADDLTSLDGETHKTVKSNVAGILLTVFVKISSLQEERATEKSPFIHAVQPFLPFQVYMLCPRDFSKF